jgi:hypothetical protein
MPDAKHGHGNILPPGAWVHNTYAEIGKWRCSRHRIDSGINSNRAFQPEGLYAHV